MKIVVAGATGSLGGLVAKALTSKGIEVHAPVRPGTDPKRLEPLHKLGLTVTAVELRDATRLIEVCRGAECVVSTVQGLRDVIIDGQTALLESAIAARVPRFIPSDFSIDFTRFAPGQNRNLDLRREFHTRLDKAAIRSTSILNGAFTYLLTSMPLIVDTEHKQIKFWERPDQVLDFTTIENTAEYTACAAVDAGTPAILRIAGDQITARQLAQTATQVFDAQFTLQDQGTLVDLARDSQRSREADSEAEKVVFPRWQGQQYLHNMFEGLAKLSPIDNDRYPEVSWTSVRQELIRAQA